MPTGTSTCPCCCCGPTRTPPIRSRSPRRRSTCCRTPSSACCPARASSWPTTTPSGSRASWPPSADDPLRCPRDGPRNGARSARVLRRPCDGDPRGALDLPHPPRGVPRRPPLLRDAAQPRHRPEHPLRAPAAARAHRHPRKAPLPGGAGALRVPPERDGPRPLSRRRGHHAVGRGASRRRPPGASRPPPPLRPRGRPDDGLRALQGGARPARRDAGAGRRGVLKADARVDLRTTIPEADMSVQDTAQELWGGETRKAVANFPVSGERVPVGVLRWLGRIKGAAARVNADLGLLDADAARRIAAAADEIAEGRHDSQFPIDVFQTGSGTSSNMNANEVIATLAGEGVHPNDDVNMGQSSNDVFPSAVHLAALDAATNTLLPALERLERSLAAKAEAFKDIVKSGRTHLMDAVPVTLGQEFAGYAAQARLGARRVRNALPQVAQIPLGGTATGTGLNTHPEFAAKVRERLSADTGLTISPPEDPFEAQANRDALVELSGALKVVAVSLTKIANDLALMGSGPRSGIGELFLPELQKGSSIMPGKVNPVIPEVVLQVAAQVIGNDTAITVGGLQGQFELNVRIPLIARNLLQSIALLSATSELFAEKCVDGIEANLAGCEASAEGTLAVATALNEHVGYDKATTLVKKAADSGRPLRDVALEEGVDAELYDRVIDLRRIAQGSAAEG